MHSTILRHTRSPLAIAIAVFALLLTASSAQAGTYTVSSTCAGWDAAGANGIAVYAGPSFGPCPVLTARNVQGNFSSASGAAGSWSFAAPGGAGIDSVRVSGLAQGVAGWQAAVFWDGGPFSGSSIINCPGGASCSGTSSTLFNFAYGVGSGASAVRAWVRCLSAAGCSNGGRSGEIQISDATITIVDSTPPSVAAGGDAAAGGWKGGTRQVVIDANDNVGVKYVRALLDGRTIADHSRSCSYVKKVPCPNGLDTLTVPFGAVAEGAHTLTVQALDSADNWGSADRTVYVDNTAPVAPENFTIQGGPGWKAQNSFALSWSNPEQRGAPIAAARYSLCPPEADSADRDVAARARRTCVAGERSATNPTEIPDLKLPKPGSYTLRLWLMDAAGNADPDSAVVIPGLGYDPTPPEVAGFAEQDPSDPARVLLRANEDVSPITGGAIEVHRRGTKVWRPLATEVRENGIRAFIDDETLRKGRYRLRAVVNNAAGLQQGTERGTDGQPKVLRLPIRLGSRLQAGRRVGKTCIGQGKAGRCRWKLRRSVPVTFGRAITLRARLTSRRKSVPSQALEVWQRVSLAGATWQHIGTVATNRHGRVRYKAPAGPARKLRFRYPGTEYIRGDNGTISLRVHAKTTFGVSRRNVINGEYVTLAGQLKGQPVPATGALIELQVRSRGKWRTFAQPRADTSGGWQYQYRFETVSGDARFRFRARVRRQPGYPYATGSSRILRVRVDGL